MTTGTVKFFNENKGYGFIAPDGGGNDAFVHVTAVERAGMRTLRENQRVSYDLQQDNRGKMSAVNLKSADETAQAPSAEEQDTATDAEAEELVRNDRSKHEPSVLPRPRQSGAGRGGSGDARPCARALPSFRSRVERARGPGAAVRASARRGSGAQSHASGTIG